jgi:hypothetical protein
MKIKIFIIIGFFVALSGCMGIVPDNDLSPKAQSVSDDGNEAITNFESHDKYNNKALAKERHATRMMAWINISTDQP